MSSENLAVEKTLIRAENLGKCYASDLTAARLLRYISPWPMKARENDFWALRNISFSMDTGTVLGIIGRNGSGKSTLLQIIAGLLEPSEGQLEVRGKISALLELGAGFNPEFTGRENIFLSGSVYGQSREKMERRFEDIVAFADIGPHLDQPVKTYSSGMFARLAFSVAIQVDPEILIVDEILSVGDIGFQAQCFRKIEQLREKGTSILFVSRHSARRGRRGERGQASGSDEHVYQPVEPARAGQASQVAGRRRRSLRSCHDSGCSFHEFKGDGNDTSLFRRALPDPVPSGFFQRCRTSRRDAPVQNPSRIGPFRPDELVCQQADSAVPERRSTDRDV
jgi:ABC-type polysaccharide/polyol phosphate transport system ATPase subunit